MGLERECPSCHRVNRPGARSCEGCGFDFVTGRPDRARRDAGPTSHPGVLGLALGTLVHPIRTMDSFFYYVSDATMLQRMALFYLVSLPIAGLIVSAGNEVPWIQATFAEAAGFAVSTLCIVGAGRLLGQSGGLLSTAVILGFARAVVTFVSALYVLAVVTGLMEPNLLVLLVFLVWSVVLNVIALTNVFGCSAGVAFFISVIAGILHSIVLRFIGAAA